MLFINFRVGDGQDKAAWLDAALSGVLGPDQVFRSSGPSMSGTNTRRSCGTR
ncbi:hypothetical protein V5P93_004359 [Actinokineospora auranticolor]|uniref:Uncharacterized protein n=1 Tax=Actinokineospora auranticolor TaxID=155976 RepID=A0A2S6GTM0_9PSEU|nr:hypothetical protein [Actinokineospora auranticolor]PPK68533.1 hypothetical protein CLV40_105262 [Actinokineospora auranticolor]